MVIETEFVVEATARWAVVSIPHRDYWLLKQRLGKGKKPVKKAKVSIPHRDYWLLKPQALRTLTIFDFQGAFARMPFHTNKTDHKKQPKIAKILAVTGARMVI